MRSIMIYEDFSNLDRVNTILDKISKYGIGTITKKEKSFLDAYSTGDESILMNSVRELDSDTIFEDSYFTFELCDTEEYDNEVHYIGTLYVPDIDLDNGEVIDGNLTGRIVVYDNGEYSIDFEKVVVSSKGDFVYDVYEFCEGIEYELDNFIDYIIQELE